MYIIYITFYRSRYFRGKRFFGDFEIHVEQADIKDLTVTANSEKGCTVSMVVISPSGSRVVRSFRPDFFLCRQSIRDAEKDYRNILLGLNIGGVPSINSLNSLYNFQVHTMYYMKVIFTVTFLKKINYDSIGLEHKNIVYLKSKFNQPNHYSTKKC